MKSIYLNIKRVVVSLSFFVITQQIVAQTFTDNEIPKTVTDISNPLQSIAKLEPRAFEYNNEKNRNSLLPAGTHYGFTVQNIQAVFPSLVRTENKSYIVGKNLTRQATVKTVDFEGLVPILVASIQELQYEVEQLKAEVQALKKNSN